MLGNFLIVGLGGAAGAMGRYAISLIPAKTAFPVFTLLTNCIGAFAIGIIAGFSSGKAVNRKWLLFWKTGVCGGFTTFSTFSLEAWGLLESGKTIYALLYVLLSLSLCLAGIVCGQYLGRRIAAV